MAPAAATQSPAALDAPPAAAASAESPAAASPLPLESHWQQKLRKLGMVASEALKISFVGHAKPARTSLEVSAQSAARATADVEQGLAMRATVCDQLLDLAEALRGMREDAGADSDGGGNTALWPRAAELVER